MPLPAVNPGRWIVVEGCICETTSAYVIFPGRPVPTVLRSGPYRLFFYAGDRDEPPHVHVERDDRIAKFWLDPIRAQRSGGFSRVEITRIERLVGDRQVELMEAWNEYFGY